MIITSSTLAALNRGYRTQYLEAYQGAKPMIGRFAMRTTSTSAEEKYGFLSAVPGMRKLVSEVQIRNLVDHNYAVANDEFESTIGVKRKDIERDNFGMYNMLFPAMGVAAAQHPDELLASALTSGFTALCYTGKKFFDVDHEPIAGKTKFSNKGTKKLSRDNYRQ